MWGNGSTTTGMLITAGRFCPGHDTTTAVAVAAYDQVKVACSDGNGTFANILEPHGTEEDVGAGGVVDYRWDNTPDGTVATADIKDLAVWTPTTGVSELYTLHKGSLAEWKVPGTCSFDSFAAPVAKWGSTTFKSLIVHREARGDSSWGGVSCAGTLGLLCVH